MLCSNNKKMPSWPIPTDLPTCQRSLRRCDNQRREIWRRYFAAQRRHVQEIMALRHQVRRLLDVMEQEQQQEAPAQAQTLPQNARMLEQFRVLWRNSKQATDCPLCLEALRPELKVRASCARAPAILQAHPHRPPPCPGRTGPQAPRVHVHL